MSKIKRALISVYDKTGIAEFARLLIEHGVEIISTGGTFTHLKQNEIIVHDIQSITHFPEILDGRVKTLHPAVHGGILAIRDDKNHMKSIREHEIGPIDMVVVNLYPFSDAVTQKTHLKEILEFIDIGGPTMLRSAAKSFADVVVVSDPSDYISIIKKIKDEGNISLDFRKKLAAKVFNLTAAYDSAIANYLIDENTMPNYLSVSYKKACELRYGENPHQKAAYYVSTIEDGAMKDFFQLHGKELSFNNIRDIDLAWKVVSEFEEVTCCGVKHSTPCSVAVAKSPKNAYDKMISSDPVSIFGGIVAFNTNVDELTAIELINTFLEIIVAPGFDIKALEILKSKKNLRIVKINRKPKNSFEHITVDGGILVQECNRKLIQNYSIVTYKQPTSQELHDMEIGIKIVKHVKSNAIVVVKDGTSIGISGGQTNRIWATEYALKQAKSIHGAILASDAFFPFRDCVDTCAKAGIRAIIQPGGSIRDQDSIQACNEHEIAMVFSGIRHFKH